MSLLIFWKDLTEWIKFILACYFDIDSIISFIYDSVRKSISVILCGILFYCGLATFWPILNNLEEGDIMP